MEYIPYGHQNITDDDIAEVIDVLKSDWITQGPKIKEFEDKFAAEVGAKYAVAVNSGTAALHCAMFAAGVTKLDKFITTPITFLSSANAGVFLGAVPIFVDIDKDTRLLDANKLENYISDSVRAIVAVDFTGKASNMHIIYEIAKKHGVMVIEDAAHSLGASYYDGTKVGSNKYADLTCFSFHPVKHITTGEGGMITTNDEKLYKKLLLFRTHGVTKEKKVMSRRHEGDWYYEMRELGFNYRITDFQAALGISQLKRLPKMITRRREIAKKYDEILSNLPLKLPIIDIPDNDAWHLYVVEVYGDNRKKIFNFLRENKIGVQVHYFPVPLQPFYMKRLGFKRGDFPVAENYYEHALSLPIFPTLTDEQFDYIIVKLKDALKNI